MRFMSMLVDGHEQWGVQTEGGYWSGQRLAEVSGDRLAAPTMLEVIAGGDRELDRIRRWHRAAEEKGLDPVSASSGETLAPVAHPGTILCVGLNYRPHVVESRMEVPTTPVLFSKHGNAVVGSGAVVQSPVDGEQLDYEAELVVVIGKTACQVPEHRAMDYVFGYCNGNDLSDRGLQFRTSQWILGKSGDGYGPMGPFVATADEVQDPGNLEIRCLRNGKEVQKANTKDMIFGVPFLIHYISRYITLQPGDVIFTGTPEGVILGLPESERRWLTKGDQLTVAIEGLGQLKTTIGPRRT